MKVNNATYKPWWDYVRFRKDQTRVLLVSLKHLLISEIYSALKRLGHECEFLSIPGNELNRGYVETMFTESIKAFKPDFVLTINHLGFDHEGFVTDLLTRYKVPFASWYVDSPHLIIRHYAENRSPYLSLFLWDKDYIEIVKRLGYGKVEYLPLGVDEELFRPIRPKENPLSHLSSKVGFVGNSMAIKVRTKLAKSRISGPLLDRFSEVSCAFNKSNYLIVREMLSDQFPELYCEFVKLPEAQALGYETSVTWQSTGWYRSKLIEQLRSYDTLIVGDMGWKEILNNDFRLHSELNYYSDLSYFYNVVDINFNATSRQMKEGVNQRIFDVTACRHLLITDWTRQLENLMEPWKEVLAYRDGNEIPEIVDRAVKDRELCEKIADKAYHRVLCEHTYCHRINKMVSIMKSIYG